MAKAVIQKNWYDIQAPDIFSEDKIGETPAEKESQLIDRRISKDLTSVFDGTDKYYVDVHFRVTDVEGNKAFTEIDGMECSKEFVSRMVRKRSDRMDLVHDTETSDDRKVRVKVVGATVSNTSTKTLKASREAIKDAIDEKASEQSYEELMENIFADNLQKGIRDAANGIYPFRELEVRKTELLE